MNETVYSGPNRLEDWLIASRNTHNTFRTDLRKSNPENITVNVNSVSDSISQLKSVSQPVHQLLSDDDNTWASVGAVAGGVIAGGIYALTYPITWIDGPLPIVDFAWAMGLTRIVYKGSQAGGEIGSWFD